MILKWGIYGGVIGLIFALVAGVDIATTVCICAAGGITIRKWIFRTFWQ